MQVFNGGKDMERRKSSLRGNTNGSDMLCSEAPSIVAALAHFSIIRKQSLREAILILQSDRDMAVVSAEKKSHACHSWSTENTRQNCFP
jgi:hypothetical protein